MSPVDDDLNHGLSIRSRPPYRSRRGFRQRIARQVGNQVDHGEEVKRSGEEPDLGYFFFGGRPPSFPLRRADLSKALYCASSDGDKNTKR